jgi:UDP-N-acetylmuramoyl-L-alanyl-D-glutamate--2,6-diaminopimelate ligase
MTHIPVKRLESALHEAGLLVKRVGSFPTNVSDMSDDSRRVKPGSLFAAVRGSVMDGHAFLGEARIQGAVAAMVEDEMSTTIPRFVVRDSRQAVSVAAAAAFDWPARELRIIGVTGTNGKSTTVGILRHLLDSPGEPAASIGTLGVLVGSAGAPAEGGAGLTTPGPVELHRVLRALVEKGVRFVVMEVSSHSLHQHRVRGVDFAAAVFTNLSHDHLDYHVTMQAYLAAKALLVALVAPDGVTVVNADDPAWTALPAGPRRVTWGIARAADVMAEGLSLAPAGSRWTLAAGGERAQVSLPLVGDFNVANALGASAAAWALGASVGDIARKLAGVPQVPGRLEMLWEAPTVIRDYSHTPDSLERALRALRPFCAGRLLVVFGCGGDRDRGKRSAMGAIAAANSDLAIVTSDNPRTEDPEAIIDQIESGMPRGSHERITDRREAIARALSIAGSDDVVLLAGKGHETYQIRGTTKYPFDEREIVREIMISGAEQE